MILSEVNFKSTDFQPANDILLVKPHRLENVVKSDSGIIIENRSSLDRPITGYVVACCQNDQGIYKGDFVVYPNTDGINVKMLDGEFLLLRIKSVIGKRVDI